MSTRRSPREGEGAATRGRVANPLVDGRGHCRLLEAVEESEEVVPVSVWMWVLSSGVTVWR